LMLMIGLLNTFFFVRAEDESPTIDWCIQALISSVLRYGVNAVILDPYNEFDHQRPSGMTETEYVSQMMRQTKTLRNKLTPYIFSLSHIRLR